MNAIKADKLTWTQVSDLGGWPNAVAVTYNIKSIPFSFLLDKHGKIVGKNLRGAALRDAVEEFLKK